MRKRGFTLLLAVILCFGIYIPVTASANTKLTYTTVSAGTYHSFAITEDGSLWAWGYAAHGRLGNGWEKSPQITPEKIMDAVVSVSAGEEHSLAIKEDGSLWAWGENSYGKLGDGTNTNKNLPVKIMDNVVSASAGGVFSAAIKSDGSLWTWGNGVALGTGSRDSHSKPVKIMDNVVFVATGYWAGLAVQSDGSLWAWGDYIPKGETYSLTPKKIMDDVVSCAAGRLNGYAIKSDGSLWAWGDNYWGQIGDGSNTEKTLPIKVMDGVRSVSAEYAHTLIIKKDDSLWSWGDNGAGQLGDGTNVTRAVPQKIMDNVNCIETGGSNSFAVKNDGSLWAWGSNNYGQLGNDVPITGRKGLGLTKEQEELLSSNNEFSPINIIDDVMLANTAVASIPNPLEYPSSWAVNSVNAAIAAGLVPDALQSKYTAAATRAEFCALAVALYESVQGEITGRSTFTDTTDVNVQKAAAIGVVSGVGDNKFDPFAQLTREQAATMLSRLADAIGKPLTKQVATFTDNSQISSWAADGVGQVQAAGIMGGVGNNTFAPKDPYTREQSIITIMRLFDIVK